MTIGTISIIIGVVLLILLKMIFRDSENMNQNSGIHGVDHDELFKEEPDVDPSWSVLPGNVWHSDDN